MIKKNIMTFLVVLLMLTTFFTRCRNNDIQLEHDLVDTENKTSETTEENQPTPTTDESTDLEDIVVVYSSEDQDDTYDLSTSTTIMLADNNSSISGEGATVNENQLSISDAGTYIVSGNLSDGQLIVDTDNSDTVQIVLDNANITNTTGSAFYVKQAEKVIVTLAEDSLNRISDSSNYANTDDDDPDAAIYSQDDLSINGSGTLIVNGNYKHGIKTVDDLVITNGNIMVTALDEGLRGKDSISISSGNITIAADGDGIKSNNDKEASCGWVSIDGGTFEITAQGNGIQAQTALLVSSGDLTIMANKDALHSNGRLSVTGGNIILSASDDGAHADDSLNISGGTIDVLSCYEGLEGAKLSISDGSISILSKDDGLNAAGGSDNEIQANDTFNDAARALISISGGYVYINSDGDGIDSNGDIEISGGTVVVDGSDINENSAIDINSGNFVVTGGTLVGIGSSQMLVTPTEATQPVVTILYDRTQSAGENITIATNDGAALFSINPTKRYDSVIISSPDLELNQTYTILYGGTYDGESLDATLYTNGTLSNATTKATVTLNDFLSLISPNGTETEYVGGTGGHKGQRGH